MHLNWDTQFFGKRVGNLVLFDFTALNTKLDVAGNQGFELIYIDSEDEVLQSRIGDFILIDVGGKIKFYKTLDLNSKQIEINPSINLYEKEDLESDLIELAYLSGHKSRFMIDTLLPSGSFERLYKLWLASTLDKMPMAAIHAYQVNGKIVGMITSQWSKKACIIDLLAVHPAFQGQGIGMQLLQQVENTCIANGIQRLEVATQHGNIGAQALYRKKIFTVYETRFLYHAHRVTNTRFERKKVLDFQSFTPMEA